MPPAVSLPVLHTDRPLHLTPTDVTRFVRLQQCERYLRLRLAERAGQKFMNEYGVRAERLAPLLSRSGSEFESKIEEELKVRGETVNYAAAVGGYHGRPANNAEVISLVKQRAPGKPVSLFQVRLEAQLSGWHLRGDVDLMLFEKTEDGRMRILIGDMKSTFAAKVEHRLQVTFYRLMLEEILKDSGIAHETIRCGILFRAPPEPDAEELAAIQPLLDEAKRTLGLEDHLLELVADPEAYARAAHDMVLGPESAARRVAITPFEQVPFALSSKCDDCLFNEFCMKWSAETKDLSLIPYMTGTIKDALRGCGVTTIPQLAALKEFAPDSSSALVVPPVSETTVKQLAASWAVGHRLDELIHRAKRFIASFRKGQERVLTYIPGKGNSTLPVSTPELNPNLIWIYLDVHLDFLEGRVYMLGALVVACKDGEHAFRREIVELTDGPPDSAEMEQRLFAKWIAKLLQALDEVAVPGAENPEQKAAPIHLVFFSGTEKQQLLEGLSRSFPVVLKESPPLYDFITQLAAFDSPIASFLDEELRTFTNYPLTCQNLQSVAAYLKFNWKTPQDFRKHFWKRFFDYVGQHNTDGQPEWFTKRARFESFVPLEYAYAAWNELPPASTTHDEFAPYRQVTPAILLAFFHRRLEAIEHVATRLQGNRYTTKTSFTIPNLTTFVDTADSVARALREFIYIERLVELAEWKATCHAPPERRVLMGESLLVRYCESDQEAGVAEQNREHERRAQLYDQFAAVFRAAQPDQKFKLTPQQKEECGWSNTGMELKLRVETTGFDCDLHEALLLSNIRDNARLILTPRWTCDERLPMEERTLFQPTAKQMLYQQRCTLLRLETEKNKHGRIVQAAAIVRLEAGFGNKSMQPFAFGAFNRPLRDGELYSLDPCPNSIYDYWCKKVVDGLCEGQPNTLHDRLVHWPDDVPCAGLPGQAEFLAGLDAFNAAGLLHDFEPGKRAFIGEYGATPILLVQGPPGTGKSYSTAFAVFARLQTAMREKRDFRVFLSCKTHAATDVLLKNVLSVQEKLRELRKKDQLLFDSHFDSRILDVPLLRVKPREPQPDGITTLGIDDDGDGGKAKFADAIMQHPHGIIAATPGGTYKVVSEKWSSKLFGHYFCDLLVLDEASQMNLPEAAIAALPLKPDGQLIVVGDHRQMPPIVKHDWDRETRRTFRQYTVYESLFDTLRAHSPPMIRFEESFRLHGAMAEFLRREVYEKDQINYHSKKRDVLARFEEADEFVAAVLNPEFPLIVVVHDEAGSQVRNPLEQALIEPILNALGDPDRHGLCAGDGLGIVVPHRAQRAALQEAFPWLGEFDPATGMMKRSAVDTVERFQGGERTAIVVSATESDRGYLLSSSAFLLDPRRLTVAVSRAKRKMILVAARSIFELFSPDEETFANSLLWKNLLVRTCNKQLWSGDRHGTRVTVWGGALEE